MPCKQYDPNKVSQDFTSMANIRQFIHEKDKFDDLFEKAETFSHVLHSTPIKLTRVDLNRFHIYKNKILTRVPLDLLQIEEIREPTPSMSLEENSDHNSDQESPEK